MNWEPNNELEGIESFDAREIRYATYWRLLPRTEETTSKLMVLPPLMQLLELNAAIKFNPEKAHLAKHRPRYEQYCHTTNLKAYFEKATISDYRHDLKNGLFCFTDAHLGSLQFARAANWRKLSSGGEESLNINYYALNHIWANPQDFFRINGNSTSSMLLLSSHISNTNPEFHEPTKKSWDR